MSPLVGIPSVVAAAYRRNVFVCAIRLGQGIDVSQWQSVFILILDAEGLVLAATLLLVFLRAAGTSAGGTHESAPLTGGGALARSTS